MKRAYLITQVEIDGTFKCLDELDALTRNIRDTKNCGLFGLYLDPKTKEYYYHFSDLLYGIPFGALVTKEAENEITISWKNSVHKFNLLEVEKYAKGLKN